MYRMHIPKYWAHGGDDLSAALRCWRWSDVSVDDARRRAEARGAELAAMLHAGTPLDRYLYGDRPMREQIIQSFVDGSGATIITRNLYGSLVLNTERTMFIDIDFPTAAKSGIGLLGRLFKRSAAEDPESAALGQLEEWAARHRDLGMRVYRTYAGLRCIVTSQPFRAADAASIALLREADSDPLYIRLCEAQDCFRARLTPKPWRCRIRRPLPRYPWTGNREESQFRQWQTAYERAIQPFRVCRLLKCLGPAETHPEVAPVVTLHDQYTCGDSSRPLA
jgi:hypothetical protein